MMFHRGWGFMITPFTAAWRGRLTFFSPWNGRLAVRNVRWRFSLPHMSTELPKIMTQLWPQLPGIIRLKQRLETSRNHTFKTSTKPKMRSNRMAGKPAIPHHMGSIATKIIENHLNSAKISKVHRYSNLQTPAPHISFSPSHPHVTTKSVSTRLTSRKQTSSTSDSPCCHGAPLMDH